MEATMEATTVHPPAPGRAGGYKSLRRCAWEGLKATRTLVAVVEDPALRIQACQAFTAATTEYRLILNQATQRA